MKNLTPEEQKRLWKRDANPIRKILLWGQDSQKNPCLLVLYGEQKAEQEIKSSPRSYYVEAYILEPVVTYTHYAVFHGVNGHLPSIPNTYYDREDNFLCHRRGYNTSHNRWEYDKVERRYRQHLIVDEKYVIKEFYEAKQNIAFNYYEENTYSDYASFLKSNNAAFEDFELIENPSTLFGFESDSPYYDIVINMFSKERLYTRKKSLSEFMKMNPSVEDYENILNVASVELACGIFQELTIEKNPVLLETAKKIDSSKELWAKEVYHNGLKRCLKQYISLFDEKLMKKQKDFIYETLPEMDFHIKTLKLNGKVLKGQELEDYLNKPYSYQNLLNQFVFGNQNLYKKNTYTDGKNIYNIKFKNTIQTAKAYGMADAIGKIAYYLDAPRTVYYLKGSGRTKAYNYYVRYLRRTLDKYKASDEEKFITAAREMLISYTDNDDLSYYSYYSDSYKFFENQLFYNYFIHKNKDNKITIDEIWDRHIDDIVYAAKNAKAMPVHKFCYHILKKADEQNLFDSYEIKELILLSQISYDKTAELFEKILFPKLDALQEFDAEIMLVLMNSKTEKLQNAAKKYFKQTNGKFKPENIADLLSLDTVEVWYNILESNINSFTAAEYIEFIKTLASKSEYFIEQQIELSEQIMELLQNSVNKLDNADIDEKQELLQNFISLLLSKTKIPDFIAEIIENAIFNIPYDTLKNMLKDIDLKYKEATERKRNIIILLKSIREDIIPKDSAVLSILDIGSARLVKTLTDIIDKLQSHLTKKTTMLLLFECNAYPLNKIAQSVFESMEIEEREKMHMILLDSPIEKAYNYGLKKLDDWYGNKTPKQFISRMLEHPCVAVKAYLSEKMEKAFSDLKEVQPDLYIYYIKTLLYLPNRVSKSKDYVYNTIPEFLKYYPEKQKEIENILLDIGSTSIKINSERALAAFAQIQKEVCFL